MDNFLNIFEDDAFSLTSLTAAVNAIDYVPGRVGELAFAGVGEGIATTVAVVESKGVELTLIPQTARGAPAPQEKDDKATIQAINIPQIKLEDTIGAGEVQNARAFGSTVLRGAQSVVNSRLTKMMLRHDLTLEHLRLGAIKGQVKNSVGGTIADLFTIFGVSAITAELDPAAVRESISDQIVSPMHVNAKSVIPSTAIPWALCGKDFFNEFIGNDDVKTAFKNYPAAERRLGGNYTFGVFEYGGVAWEQYRGSDDDAVGIAADEARIFWVGVPGMFAEWYAPADFMETVNTIGLPRYAKIAPDKDFNRFVKLHTQQNVLPICLRPATLGTVTFGS